MARAVFVLSALSLLLPAHAAGLQHSFRSSIMGLLQVNGNPFGAAPRAGAESRLLANKAAAKARAKPAAVFDLQLGADHPELTAINHYLDNILAELDLQDQQDTALLITKTSNHTDAVTVTRQANASLAQKETESTAAVTVCHDKMAARTTDARPLVEDVEACNLELMHLEKMDAALRELTAVIPIDETLGFSGFLQLANQIKSVPAQDKASFINLLGRDYGSDTQNVRDAIGNLKTKIVTRKTAAQEALLNIDRTEKETCATADAAASQVVIYKMRQAQALTQEQATSDDLMTTTSMITASRQETHQLRTTINDIKAKIQDLANVPATSALQKMPSSMLQMHMAKFSDTVEAIKTMLRAMDTRVENQRAAEMKSKNEKRDAWSAAKDNYNELDINAVVQSSNLTTLSTRLSELTGTKTEAKALLDDEITSQLRETTLFNQLKLLLDNLSSQGSESNALATHPTKEMLALAMGAERNHEDLITRFNSLIRALEAEMEQKKTRMQSEYDRHLAEHTQLATSHDVQTKVTEKAHVSEQEAKTLMEAALLEFDTAATSLDDNNKIRDREQELIRALLTMVDELHA